MYVSVSAVAQVMRNTSHTSRVSRSSSPLVSLRVGKILPHNSWKSYFIWIQLLHGNLVCPQQQLAPSPTNQRRQAAPVMSKPVMLPPSKTLRPDPHRSAHRPDGPVWKAAPEWEIILLSCFLIRNVPDIPSVLQPWVCNWWHGGASGCHVMFAFFFFFLILLC